MNIVRLLLDRGANAKTMDEEWPRIQDPDPRIRELLLARGANIRIVHAQNDYGHLDTVCRLLGRRVG